MTSRGFEMLCSNIFAEYNYDVKLTQATRDGGVDIIVEKGSKSIFVECKYHKKPVGIKTVMETLGVIQLDKVNAEYHR